MAAINLDPDPFTEQLALEPLELPLLGWHVAKKGDRWAALEPIRQGVCEQRGEPPMAYVRALLDSRR